MPGALSLQLDEPAPAGRPDAERLERRGDRRCLLGFVREACDQASPRAWRWSCRRARSHHGGADRRGAPRRCERRRRTAGFQFGRTAAFSLERCGGRCSWRGELLGLGLRRDAPRRHLRRELLGRDAHLEEESLSELTEITEILR